MSTTKSPVPRPTRADARRNYDRLLAAADRAFRKHGTETSLEEIARQAGVGVGTLYRHFPSRDALLEALMHDRFSALTAEGLRLREDHDPRAALASWLGSFATGASTYRGLPASVLTTLHAKGSRLYESCHAMSDAGIALITNAQHAGAIRDDVDPHDILAMVGGIAWVGEQTPKSAGRVDRLLDLVMAALTKPAS